VRVLSADDAYNAHHETYQRLPCTPFMRKMRTEHWAAYVVHHSVPAHPTLRHLPNRPAPHPPRTDATQWTTGTAPRNQKE